MEHVAGTRHIERSVFEGQIFRSPVPQRDALGQPIAGEGQHLPGGINPRKLGVGMRPGNSLQQGPGSTTDVQQALSGF